MKFEIGLYVILYMVVCSIHLLWESLQIFIKIWVMSLFDWSSKQKINETNNNIINNNNNNNNNTIMGKPPYYTNLSPFFTLANTTPYGIPNNCW